MRFTPLTIATIFKNPMLPETVVDIITSSTLSRTLSQVQDVNDKPMEPTAHAGRPAWTKAGVRE